ncbi:MAG: hypothetical protein ABII68_03620 [Pseudomonadota bacterium]
MRRFCDYTVIGHGSVYSVKEASIEINGYNRKPIAILCVYNTAGIKSLIDIFEKFPLRAKKATDFGFWKLAALSMFKRDYSSVEKYAKLCSACKKYDYEPTSPENFLENFSQQLSLNIE